MNKDLRDLGKLISGGKKDNEAEEHKIESNAKVVDCSALETWLEATLLSATVDKVPGTKESHGVKHHARGAISQQYGLDRVTLLNSGLSQASIAQLYRTLYVTSLGFHDTINTLVDKHADDMMIRSTRVTVRTKQSKQADAHTNAHLTKASLISAIWLTLSVLLESIQKQQHRLKIVAIQGEYEAKLKVQEAMHEDELREGREAATHLRDQLQKQQEEI